MQLPNGIFVKQPMRSRRKAQLNNHIIALVTQREWFSVNALNCFISVSPGIG